MKCEKVIRELSAYVLDELELERRKEVSEHLRLCNVCKLELQRVQKANNFIKTAVHLDTSAQRREVVVNAMSRADLTKGAGIRRYLFISGIAAAVLLGISIFIIFHNARPLKMVLEEVDGTALALNKSDWETLTAKSVVNEGTWITTQPNTLAKFRLEMSDKALGTLYLSSGDLVRVCKSGGESQDIQISINKGAIYGELEPLESGKYVIASGQGDSAIIKNGSFEAGLKYTMAIKRSPPPPPDKDSYTISYTNLPLVKVMEFISKNVNRDIELSSKQIEAQRVNFYSNGKTGDAIFADFEASLKSSGLAVVKAGKDKLKIISVLNEPHCALTQRLFIRMSKGVAEVYSDSKKRIVQPSEECAINSEGDVAARKVKNTEIAQWKDTKSQDYFAQGNIPIFMDVALGEKGYKVSKRALSANIEGKNVEITIPDVVIGENEEGVVPMKVKFAGME